MIPYVKILLIYYWTFYCSLSLLDPLLDSLSNCRCPFVALCAAPSTRSCLQQAARFPKGHKAKGLPRSLSGSNRGIQFASNAEKEN